MSDARLLKPQNPVGITGYGAYVPRYRLPAREVARIWAGGRAALPVQEKSVAGIDEDVATMSIEAARNAIARAGIEPNQLRAVWVGSESHPYAVKPTSTIVAEAIGAVPDVQAADWQFACKAGTEAMVAAIGFVRWNIVRDLRGLVNKHAAVAVDESGCDVAYVGALVAVGRKSDVDTKLLQITQPHTGGKYIHLPASIVNIVFTIDVIADSAHQRCHRGAVGCATAVTNMKRPGWIR